MRAFCGNGGDSCPSSTSTSRTSPLLPTPCLNPSQDPWQRAPSLCPLSRQELVLEPSQIRSLALKRFRPPLSVPAATHDPGHYVHARICRKALFWNGAQLDTTLVSPPHLNQNGAGVDASALPCSLLAWPKSGPTREGGRWNTESTAFINALAKHKATANPPHLRTAAAIARFRDGRPCLLPLPCVPLHAAFSSCLRQHLRMWRPAKMALRSPKTPCCRAGRALPAASSGNALFLLAQQLSKASRRWG